MFDYSLCLVYIHTLVLFKLLIVLFIYVFSHIIHFILSICIYSHSSSSHFMPYVFKITLMLYAITPKLTLSILGTLSDELVRGGVEFLLLIHLICLCLCVSVSLSFMSKLHHLSRPCSEPRHSVIHSVPCLLFLSFVPCPPSSIPSPRHLPPHFTHHSFPATRSALVSLSSLISLWPMAVQVVSVSFPQSGPTA